MTELEYNRKLDELDRLLNDPDVSLEPARVWALLAEVSAFERVEPRLRRAEALPLSRPGLEPVAPRPRAAGATGPRPLY